MLPRDFLLVRLARSPNGKPSIGNDGSVGGQTLRSPRHFPGAGKFSPLPEDAVRDDRYVSDRDAATIREAVGLVAFLVRLAFGIVKLVFWCWVGFAVLMLAIFLLSALTS